MPFYRWHLNIDFGISTGFWIQSLTNIESQINFYQEVINTISPQRFQKKNIWRGILAFLVLLIQNQQIFIEYCL